MKIPLFLLLTSGLASAAYGSNQHVDIEFGAGIADTQQRSLGASQLGLTWYPVDRLGIEAWFGKSSDDSLDVVADESTVGQFNSWIDRTQGVGVRFRFFGDETRRLQPFARLGWARANVRFEGIGIGVVTDLSTGVGLSTLVIQRMEQEATDNSMYLGLGAGYALDGGWRMSAQVLHIPAKVAERSFGRTEALIGLQYRF